ncbi:MAG: adenylate/guanylate cyclase domain-containing protein [Candidatus Promineofilum sp.]|nr:adenylate/guanylate cyclase domain-containing protein [Promineifilum sp.]
MRLFRALEKRLRTIADDDTYIRQLLISYVPAIFTTLFGLVWTILFFAAGLPLLGRILAAYSLVCLLATVLAMTRPRFGPVAIVSLALAGIVSNLLAHLTVGGFAAGIWFLLWVVILPLSVYLSGARRQGVLVLAVALLAVVAAVVLDPRLDAPLALPEWLLLIHNGFVLSASVLILFLWGVTVIQQLDVARRRADALLLNVLPAPVADRLKHDTSTIADGFDEVTVLFADIVNFTTMSADTDPVDVVNFLNDLFSQFDDLVEARGLEKIKTIGDAYMVAGGLPTPRPDHCEAVVAFGLDMLDVIKRCKAWHGQTVHMRIGVNTGPVVAGVIGRRKFIYDLWGDTVNTASRMESNGLVDVIQVTQVVRDRLAGKYVFEERLPITIKGKGEMVTYVLRPEL